MKTRLFACCREALLYLSLLFLFALPLCAHAQGDSAPVASWGFDEGSGAAAKSSAGLANDATLQGGATWGDPLVGAHALVLPGSIDSFAQVTGPVVDTTRSYTAMACVKLAHVSGYQTLVSIDGDQVSGFFLQFRDDSREFALTEQSGDSVSSDHVVAESDVAPLNRAWYHVAGVYDAAAQTISLYVNGALQQTVSYTNAWKANGNTVIGRGKYGGNAVDAVNGSIDDVRLYQRALSAAEILAVAKADLPAASIQHVTLPTGPASLSVDAAHPGSRINPMFYGMMTEEINHSYDGGLYAELIQNRTFKDDAATPVHWSLIQADGAAGTLALDTSQPLNKALDVSLKVSFDGATPQRRVGIANEGYWGIPIKPNTKYRASFYAKAAPGFTGPLTVSLENGGATAAQASVNGVSGEWKQYTVQLRTGRSVAESLGQFVIAANHPGTVWLNLVSLFPPTYNNRPNGNRPDLMQMMAAMKPAFLRLPGGNYLEGDTIDTRFDWKKTIGPLETRPGHQGPWGYRSSDGLGLLEYLEWCEDLHIEPLLAVYAGYALKGEVVTAGADLQPYVQDALDEIEYLTGGADTTWGAERVRDGHPAPFPLHYVEIGNEDWFDKKHTYDARFAQFYDAIKAKYPSLQLIATTPVTSRTPDILDEHYYLAPRRFMMNAHKYDAYKRSGPKIFVGEWASQEGRPTPDLKSAIGDAAWMTGMERNSDIVILESYAPLMVNVNPGAWQWRTNLIGYDALHSFGSPAYYAQVMFASHHGDIVLPTTFTSGDLVSESVTRDSKTGAIYVKLVNGYQTPQQVRIHFDGLNSLGSTGTAIVLSGSHPTDVNSIKEPNKIVPVTQPISGASTDFSYTAPANSATVLCLTAK